MEVRSPGPPGTHVVMVQGFGKRAEGSPVRKGVGTGSGRRGARTGSQVLSLRRRDGARSVRGRRTANSSPRRHSWLSRPVTVRWSSNPARSGCCSCSRDRTTPSSISKSLMQPVPTPGIGTVPTPSSHQRPRSHRAGSGRQLPMGTDAAHPGVLRDPRASCATPHPHGSVHRAPRSTLWRGCRHVVTAARWSGPASVAAPQVPGLLR